MMHSNNTNLNIQLQQVINIKYKQFLESNIIDFLIIVNMRPYIYFIMIRNGFQGPLYFFKDKFSDFLS